MEPEIADAAEEIPEDVWPRAASASDARLSGDPAENIYRITDGEPPADGHPASE